MTEANVEIDITASVHPSCVLGEDGFSFTKVVGKDGFYPQLFPQNVQIKKDVHIKSGTTVHAGRYRPTIIGEGTIIDSNCHIAHDVQIGKNCVIGAGVMFGGAVTVGNNCEIWMGAVLHQKITIHDGAVVGANTYVRHDVQSNKVVYGMIVEKFKDECKKFNTELR